MTIPTTPPKIIFFDIDDTLCIKSVIQAENRVPDSTKLALHALKAKGIQIAIATGRAKCIFPPSVFELIDELGIDVFVTINGQYNECQGKPLADFALSLEQLWHTTNHLQSKNLSHAYMTANEVLAVRETPCMVNALTSLRIDYRLIDRFDFDEPVYQMLTFYPDNSQENLELLPSLKSIRWHKSGVDILPKDGSKARGIERVLAQLGLDMTQAWAFGDGLNDIEMLQAVGFGVAMGNACPELKQVADFVCPTIYDDGIFVALKTLGLIDI